MYIQWPFQAKRLGYLNQIREKNRQTQVGTDPAPPPLSLNDRRLIGLGCLQGNLELIQLSTVTCKICINEKVNE